jgi:spore maturation protein CgeB
VVAGPQYPADIQWLANVDRAEHLAAREHRRFYNSQKFTLNVTCQDMVRAGYSPSVRLFEAAACGVPIITDAWPGLESFFNPYTEILLASSFGDVTSHLKMPAEHRRTIAENARKRVLRYHSAAARAQEFETCALAAMEEASLSSKRSRSVLQQVPRAC